jgi:hypothetical protein
MFKMNTVLELLIIKLLYSLHANVRNIQAYVLHEMKTVGKLLRRRRYPVC